MKRNPIPNMIINFLYPQGKKCKQLNKQYSLNILLSLLFSIFSLIIKSLNLSCHSSCASCYICSGVQKPWPTSQLPVLRSTVGT